MQHEITIQGMTFDYWVWDDEEWAKTKRPNSINVEMENPYGNESPLEDSINKEDAIRLRDWLSQAIEEMD